ncbi:hypothetical protein SAMD00019534_070110 [Acytostelium subglobosum LB1]|uniref:hypothetical protein n=1 Tax=Acytostelium subglobosum LB1 TaxID=1410327 RepID=UPI000644FAE0|nr:hypothetical protein SAMD00019534_070110 [Acytostelium subglobosum LB1]GAM23836.1 hypothetical protein SAMD00019534_070110 [Acytostelium subglobosum LB1]|eukprot:XP_012752872.1 hypothetical protein SAMD00019534_070110 [Acytostelium subglobosum LB1]
MPEPSIEVVRDHLRIINSAAMQSHLIQSGQSAEYAANFEQSVQEMRMSPAPGNMSLAINLFIDKHRRMDLRSDTNTVFIITKSLDNPIATTTDQVCIDTANAIQTIVQLGVEVIAVELTDTPKAATIPNVPNVNYITVDAFRLRIESIKPSTNPLCIRVFPAEDKIQMINDDVRLKMLIECDDGPLPADTVIEFPDNFFYRRFKFTTPPPKEGETVTMVNVHLRVIRRYDFAMPPPRTFFTVHMPNSNNVIKGFIEIPVALFTKEFMNDYGIFFLLDGIYGVGKSTLLNGIYNIFTMGRIVHHIVTSKDSSQHCTLCYNYISIRDYLEAEEYKPRLIMDIIKNLNVVMVDKAGISFKMNGGRDNYIDMGSQMKGCCYDGTNVADDSQKQDPNPMFAVDACVFVATITSFKREEVESQELKAIKDKLCEPTKYGQQSILVVTKGDLQTARGLEELKRGVADCAAHKYNVFYINNYTDNTPYRDIDKDHSLFLLLHKIKEVARNRVTNNTIKKNTNKTLQERPTCTTSNTTTSTTSTRSYAPPLAVHMPEPVQAVNVPSVSQAPVGDKVTITVLMATDEEDITVTSTTTLKQIKDIISSRFGIEINDYVIKHDRELLWDDNHTFDQSCRITVAKKLTKPVIAPDAEGTASL